MNTQQLEDLHAQHVNLVYQQHQIIVQFLAILIQIQNELIHPKVLVERNRLLLLKLIEVSKHVNDAFQHRGVKQATAETPIYQNLRQLHVLNEIQCLNLNLLIMC